MGRHRPGRAGSPAAAVAGPLLVRTLKESKDFQAQIVSSAAQSRARKKFATCRAGHFRLYQRMQRSPAYRSCAHASSFPRSMHHRAEPAGSRGHLGVVRGKHDFTAALTPNVSRGGLAIRTTNPLDKGTRGAIRIGCPGQPAMSKQKQSWLGPIGVSVWGCNSRASTPPPNRASKISFGRTSFHQPKGLAGQRRGPD